jgi:hypothetical protein
MKPGVAGVTIRHRVVGLARFELATP